MEKELDIAKQTRQNFIELMDSLSIDQLNQVPSGFSNNIAWNFGHIIVSQQMLCYVRGNLKPRLDEKYLLKYQKGTRPENFIQAEELDELKKLSSSLLDNLKEDVNNGILKDYSPFTTHYGVKLDNIQDAISFFPSHEALHLGIAMAIKKLVK